MPKPHPIWRDRSTPQRPAICTTPEGAVVRGYILHAGGSLQNFGTPPGPSCGANLNGETTFVRQHSSRCTFGNLPADIWSITLTYTFTEDHSTVLIAVDIDNGQGCAASGEHLHELTSPGQRHQFGPLNVDFTSTLRLVDFTVSYVD